MDRSVDHGAELQATYDRQAQNFDASRDGRLFEREWLDRFVALLPKGGRVLDVGCGTGKPIAVYLVSQGFRVTGVDFSEAMLDLACKRLPEQSWRYGDMRALELGETFDGLIAFNSLFHLTPKEQREALPRIAQHGNDNCALLTTTGDHEGQTTGKVGGETVYHGSLSPAEYEAILAAEGFAVLDHRTDRNCNDHTVLLAQKREGEHPS